MSSLREALPKVNGTLPGPNAKKILDRRAEAVPNGVSTVYKVVIKRGEGAMIEDVDGNILMDWVGGVGVMNVGYSRQECIDAVKDQADKFFHSMFNITTHEGYVALAEEMNKIVPVKGDKKKTMFCCAGAEADENAIKIARNYTGRPNVMVFTGAFHGRTNFTMALTAKKSYAVKMGPFPGGICRAEFPYMYRRPGNMTEEEAIDYYIKKLEQAFIEGTEYEACAAIMFEPVQGEGGFIPAPVEWVKAVRKLCDEHGILMICDEVQCGWARTGKLFASQYFADAGAAPDIMTTAKSIAAGLPMSAVTVRAEIADAVTDGTIGGTFGANAFSAASALQVVRIMQEEDFPAKAMHIGEKTMKAFNEMKDKYDCIGDVRGLGAMIAIEFVKDRKTKEPDADIVPKIIQSAMQNGLIMELSGTYNNVIRFLCPLCATDGQLEAGYAILDKAIADNI